MSTWAEGLRNSIDYIEEHLTEDIQIDTVAQQAYVSAFHFQRIFSVLCGFSVAEYIRNRRMTLAARELSLSDVKVIDIAVKYGYDSPDSFTRAFTKFHGITPSAAKEKGAQLKDFAPLRISLSLEGGTMIDYRIEEKASFTVIGKKKTFSNTNSYREIPKYWDEFLKSEDHNLICGCFAVCMDSDGTLFDYMIADLYQPWEKIPEGLETLTFAAGTWAVFPCKMSTLQDTNTKMWKEWLPNCKEYRLGKNYNIEIYDSPCEENIGESYCELWLPLERIQSEESKI